jgi:hypothetical protein
MYVLQNKLEKKVFKMKRKAFGILLVFGFVAFSCFAQTSGDAQKFIGTWVQINGTSVASHQLVSSDPNKRGDPDTAHWDIAVLDTAAHEDYLTSKEKDVILEMNKVRADPKKYAELYIKPMLQYNWGGPFGANSYLAPGETVYTSTQEGKNGIQSCIDDLSRRPSMPPLLPAKGLFLAAKDHADASLRRVSLNSPAEMEYLRRFSRRKPMVNSPQR